MSCIGGGNGGGTGAVQALDWKEAVETVATADIALTGEQTLNGLLTAGSRVGVVAQADPTENGIYVSSGVAWTRSADADTDAKVTNGMAFAVGDSGSTKAGAIYILTTPDPITLGVTGLVFSELTALPAHAPTHENSGSDEINVGGLSGVLADPQPASLATLLDLDSVGDLVFPKVGPPTATTDSGAGWVVGDHIQDTLTGIIYAAESVALGAAVWEPITATSNLLESGGARLPLGSIPVFPTILKVDGAGDVVGGTTIGTSEIADDAVTNVKLADMAAATIKGNNTGGAADPADLTATQVTALLNVFTSALKGLVPASGGGTANFLRADGTFAVPPGDDPNHLGSFDANDALFPATNAMGVSSRNGHPILAADDTTAENAIFNDVMSRDYAAGSVLVDIDWVATTAVIGGVTWGVEIERNAPGGQDMDADGFAAQQTGTSTTNAASGVRTRTTITLTQAQFDAITAGDAYRMRIQRVVGDVGDDLVGDAEITDVTVRQ